MIKAGIIGSTGYVGEELIRILLRHPQVEIIKMTSKSFSGKVYSDVYQSYLGLCEIECIDEEVEQVAIEVDVIFMALPHGIVSKNLNDAVLAQTKVIDLGADFRLTNKEVYEDWYSTEHHNAELLKNAVYGLCEWNREEIRKTSLVANPGCYPTCSILSLAPLLKEGILEKDSIIIDAKSGISGAGRSLNLGTHFAECNESIKAYKVATHRHIPEIEQQLEEISGGTINVSFTPHLVPMNRGILITTYGRLTEIVSYEEISTIYNKYYGEEFFIRLMNKDIYPETRWVKGSNYCDIGFVIDERTNRVIIVGAIDNLVKGAAGQAVQNMNIMFGLDERMGLTGIPLVR